MTVTDHLGMCIASLLPDPLAPTPQTVRDALDAAAGAGFGEVSVWAWQLPLVTDDAGTPFAVVVIPVDDKLAIRAQP